MKCIKCEYTIPEDSVFCQYCGSNIEKTFALKAAHIQTKIIPQESNVSKQKRPLGLILAIIILSVALVISVGVIFYQQLTYQSAQKQLKETCAHLEQTLSDQADDMYFLNNVVAIRSKNGNQRSLFHVYGCPYLEDVSEIRAIKPQADVSDYQRCDWCMK